MSLLSKVSDEQGKAVILKKQGISIDFRKMYYKGVDNFPHRLEYSIRIFNKSFIRIYQSNIS